MLAIISDIHANIEALTTVYRWLDQNRVDEVLCLGDVVGYGPNPLECVDLIMSRCRLTPTPPVFQTRSRRSPT